MPEHSTREQAPEAVGTQVARHQIERVAAGIRRAAAEAGVMLPASYARRVAADGLTHEADLGVTRLGAGVVIHTTPQAKDRLPVLIGYADTRGQWHRDGSRHMEASPVDCAPVAGSAEAIGVGL